MLVNGSYGHEGYLSSTTVNVPEVEVNALKAVEVDGIDRFKVHFDENDTANPKVRRCF
jgi:hypothetical protein